MGFYQRAVHRKSFELCVNNARSFGISSSAGVACGAILGLRFNGRPFARRSMISFN
jgi:hypothetical protein